MKNAQENNNSISESKDVFKKNKDSDKTGSIQNNFNEKPHLFDYIDYRQYLSDIYNYRKNKNPSYSESAFIQAAGFGKNSRGYLKLILEEKRNLTTKTSIGFAKALKLNAKETMYFENLVNFNQAKDEDEKIFFFERMKVCSQGEKSKPMEVLESQYRYISNWHLVALREIVNLADFKEETNYIYNKLRKRVPKEEIARSIEDLINLGLLARDEDNKLVQSDPIVTFSDNKHNFKNTTNLHTQFIDIAKDMLKNEKYEDRAVHLTTLSCSIDDFEKLRADIQEFSNKTLKKYVGDNEGEADIVIQMGMQLFKLTE